MTVEISVNVTEDRMRSVHHSVSLMISTPKRMEQLPSVTVTPWSRRELKLRISMLTLQINLLSNLAF